MQKLIFFIAFYFIIITANAQNLHATVFGGFSNYQGDLQSKRFTLNQANAAFGVGVLYQLSDNLNARANITFGKIGAADKYNPKNVARNLSFSSPITDVHLGLDYCFFNLYEKGFTPYIFAGISYFHFNPSAIDSIGRKVYLQPLSTEGEGFYPGRKIYNLNQFAIPFGGGVKWALNENIAIAFEIGLRKTFTDYLDDVSTNYINQNILLANRGQEAVNLAYRGGELKTGLGYPPDGTQRGSAKSKDWYYFSGLTLIIRLPRNGQSLYTGGKTKTGCPNSVL